MTNLDMKNTTFAQLNESISSNLDADLYVYGGDISTKGYDAVCSTFESLKKSERKPNLAIFLNTYGGDAHAGYRMARAFGHHYDDLTLYVFGPCKSAGTLMALGFNKIVIGDRGELGPMDVQMASKEEMYEYNSGLDMIQAMEFLQRHAKATFHGFLHDIRTNTGLATKSAGEMAKSLTQGLFGSMYGQLDPVRLGHVQRTMSIAHAYGRRLIERSKSLRSTDALNELVYTYPCHEFVIDRKEADQRLFAEGVVRCPTDDEAFLGTILSQIYHANQKETEFLPLSKVFEQKPIIAADQAAMPTEISDTPALVQTKTKKRVSK